MVFMWTSQVISGSDGRHEPASLPPSEKDSRLLLDRETDAKPSSPESRVV